MAHEALAECVFHTTHRVAGRKLRPFSIWHAWVLAFAGSPFVGAAQDGDTSDLALAIEVCSQPAGCPGNSRWLSLKPNTRLVKRILKEGPRKVADQFRAYLLDYSAPPKCWDAKEGRPVKSDLCLYLVAVLMRHGRRNEAEAWATEYGYARHLTLALAEAGGNDIPLMSAADEEALREAGYDV